MSDITNYYGFILAVIMLSITPKPYNVNQLGIIDYDKTKKVFALGGINLENLEIIKKHFYGFAGIRVINDILS